MANGEGGSRFGGFLRGLLVGVIVCGVGLIVLSLATPLPERVAVDVEAAGETAGEAMGEATGESLPVTVEPAEPEAAAGTEEAGQGQPAEGGEPATGQAGAADPDDQPQATVPQAGSDDAATGADDEGSDFSDEPATSTGSTDTVTPGTGTTDN